MNQEQQIEQIKSKLAALAPSHEALVETAETQAAEVTIQDDDPELSRYLVEPNSEIAKLFPKLVSTDLAGAKRKLAKSRHEKSLLVTAGNEALPIEQRIDAAVTWRSLRPAGNAWERLDDAELVERLSIHPHWDRLQEISTMVCGPNGPPLPGKDRQKYISDLKALIDEFQNLRNQYPKREAPVMLSLEDALIWAAKWNSPPKDDFIPKPVRTVEDPKASVKEFTAIYDKRAADIRQQLAELQKTMGNTQ